MAEKALLLVIALSALVLHELGHVGCAIALGVKVKRIGVRWGISPYTRRDPGTDLQNLAISLAGPMVNLLLSTTFMLAPWLHTNILLFAMVNSVLGVWNLLPLPLSDGRRILTLLRNVETTGAKW